MNHILQKWIEEKKDNFKKRKLQKRKILIDLIQKNYCMQSISKILI